MLRVFAQQVCECVVGTHGKLAQALASHLRPAALAEFDKTMAAVFVAGAEVEQAQPANASLMHTCD